MIFPSSLGGFASIFWVCFLDRLWPHVVVLQCFVLGQETTVREDNADMANDHHGAHQQDLDELADFRQQTSAATSRFLTGVKQQMPFALQMEKLGSMPTSPLDERRKEKQQQNPVGFSRTKRMDKSLSESI